MGQYTGPKTFRSFVRYAMALHRERQEAMAYRIYVTESLRLIPQDKYLTHSFTEVLNPARNTYVDGDKIVADVIERAELVVT